MKNLLFLILTCLQIATLFSQCPLELNFNKQSQIDSFPINYPNCRSIPKSVNINQVFSFDSDISNLNGLLGIDSIGENLWINGSHIKNLHGLDSLKFVNNQLSIGLDSIENLEGLGNLNFANGLYIENCRNLRSTKGVEKLKSASLIEIFNVPNLASLEGFSGLDSLYTRFKISGTKISNLHGLENLRTFGFGGVALFEMKNLKSLSGLNLLNNSLLNIENCDSLTSLVGLNSYKTSYGISIKDNDLLENLNGLEQLEQFEWSFPTGLYLENNPKLVDLSALNRPIPMQLLEIKNNTSLSICSVRSVCDYLENPDILPIVMDNLPNCNSVDEVLSLCTTSTYDFEERRSFQVFPNPVFEGEILEIRLENEFVGMVKMEVLSLDGRVLLRSQAFKTLPTFNATIPIVGFPNTFIVRVSDEKSTNSRLVFKL
jgi:hypothetical protein